MLLVVVTLMGLSAWLGAAQQSPAFPLNLRP